MNNKDSMNENSVTFLSQYVTACFFPSRYRELIEDKKHSIWSYVLVLVLLFTLIADVVPFLAWEASVGGMENLLKERLPAFRIHDGVMDCDQPMSFALGNACHIKVDTSVEEFSSTDIKEEGYAFYFSRTNMVTNMAGMAREIPYKQLGEEEINNETLVSLLPIYRISLVFSMGMLYVVNLLQYLAMALFFAFLCLGLVRDPGGDRLPFGVTFSIVIYARTLFVLIQNVGMALGYPMNGLFVELVLVCATFSHIFRGQASVLKIDLKK